MTSPTNHLQKILESKPIAGTAGWAVGMMLCAIQLSACSAADSPPTNQTPVATPAVGAKIQEVAPMPSGPTVAAPARDGNIAIREEFDAAVLRNTVDALELFILRHPKHPLAQEAKQRLAQLKG